MNGKRSWDKTRHLASNPIFMRPRSRFSLAYHVIFRVFVCARAADLCGQWQRRNRPSFKYVSLLR